MESTKQNFGPKIIGKIIGIFVIICFLCEHLGRKYQLDIRPSFVLNILMINTQIFFENIGRGFARLSSFLTQIDLKEICITVTDIFCPTFYLIISPMYAVYGYLEIAASYLQSQPLVYIGSGIIIIGMIIISCKLYASKYWAKKLKKN